MGTGSGVSEAEPCICYPCESESHFRKTHWSLSLSKRIQNLRQRPPTCTDRIQADWGGKGISQACSNTLLSWPELLALEHSMMTELKHYLRGTNKGRSDKKIWKQGLTQNRGNCYFLCFSPMQKKKKKETYYGKSLVSKGKSWNIAPDLLSENCQKLILKNITLLYKSKMKR